MVEATSKAKLLATFIGTVRNAMAAGLPYQRISERVIRLARADVLAWGRTRHGGKSSVKEST